MFRYEQVYWLESPWEADSMVLTGASLDPEWGWTFWRGNEVDDISTRSIPLTGLVAQPNGEVSGEFRGFQFTFKPVMPEQVRAEPRRFGLTSAEAESVQSSADVYLRLHAMRVPDWYDERYTEVAEANEALETDYRALHEGKEATPGTVHYWASRDEYYMKYSDGSWRRMKPDLTGLSPDFSAEDWKDSDPSLPTDSLGKHLAGGRLTPARQKLHNRVLGDLFAGKHRTANPTAVITMGLPASGKSALSALLHTQPVDDEDHGNLVVLDPDRHREALPEYREAREKKVKNAAKIVHNEVTMLNDEALEKATSEDPQRPGERYSFVLDGVGGNANWYAQTIQRLKQRGYNVKLLMAHTKGTDEISGKDILKIRAEQRGQETGRFIDNTMIDRLHTVLPQNFMQLESLVDEAAVFDTTDVGNAALMYSSEKQAGGVTATAGVKNWWQEAREVLRVTESEEAPMTEDFKKICDLYARALNADATMERKPIVPAGQGFIEPLLDPVSVPVEAPNAPKAEDKVGTIRMVNGSFYEYQGDGVWTKADWFP